MANDNKSFEELITRLEEIVNMLDEGNLPLEKSLELFEEGISLARRCSSILNDARGKLEKMISTDDGGIKFEDFEI